MSADGTRVEAPRAAGDAEITLAGVSLRFRPCGALYWPDESILCVGDLHLGRAERMAREGSGLLPPYETQDTLDRLEAEIAALAPERVICLGDSFDDLAAARNLADELVTRLDRLAAGRRWIWIAGNHDPGPVSLSGTHLAEARIGALVFRHVAAERLTAGGEISAHFHPKARLCRRGIAVSRRCFLCDGRRVILPAFGTYTGGLDVSEPVFDGLVGSGGVAYLLGERVVAVRRARLG